MRFPLLSPSACIGIALCGAVTGLFAGVASAETNVSEREYQLPKCDKPVVSLTVGNIVCKSAGCQRQAGGGRSDGLAMLLRMSGNLPPQAMENIGDGMQDMLTTILKSTNCFDIQERQAMDELQKELQAAGQKLTLKPADYIIGNVLVSG